MASEIFCRHVAGQNLYAVIWRGDDVWDGSAFVAPVAGNWANYDVPLAEQTVAGAASRYVASFPTAITAGRYVVELYVRGGGSPAVSDLAFSDPVNFDWSGTQEVAATVSSGGAVVALGQVAGQVAAGFSGPALLEASAPQQSGVMMLLRIPKQTGGWLAIADVSAVALTVTDLATNRAVTNFDSVALTPSAVFFDTLQQDGWAFDDAGYNFRYVLPAAARPAVTTYRVELLITPAAGEPFWIVQNITSARVFGV